MAGNKYDVGMRVGVDGEKEFRSALSSIDGDLKAMGAEMKAVTSAFLGNEKSVRALTAQNELLTNRFETLTEKAEIQRRQLENLDKAGVDPTSEEYRKLQRELYGTEAEMNKTAFAIQQNTERLENNGLTAAEAAKSQEKAAKETARAQEKAAKEAAEAEKQAAKEAEAAHARHVAAVKKVTAALAAMGAAVGAAVGAVAKMTVDAAYAADDLNTMAKTTGLSTRELQRFQFASEQIDVSLDTLTGSMSKLTKNMATASKGTGDTYKAFKQLGVEVKNQDGSLRDRNDVFNETIAALGRIENETERDAVAMQIFGKSAQDLNPLIMGGVDALQALGDQAEEAGLILSQDALDQLNLVSDAMDTFKATTSSASKALVVGFAEPLAGALNTATGYVMQLVGAFQDAGWDGLSEAFGDVLVDLTGKINEYLPKIVDFGMDIVSSVVLGIAQMLPEIITTAATIMTTLMTGIIELLPQLIPVAVETVLALTEALVDNVDTLVDAAIAITLALGSGLIDALPKLLEKAPVILDKLVTAIVTNAPKLLVAAAQLIGQLVAGIIGSLGRIGEAAGSIVGTILKGLVGALAGFVDAGGQIVAGIWQGIQGKAEWFKQQVRNFFSGIVNGVKRVLGIASPSKVFESEIGENMALGVGKGFVETMRKVEADMNGAIPLPDVPDLGTSGAAAAKRPFAIGFSPAELREALSGMAVIMDGRKVGRLVTGYQLEAARVGSIG